MNHFIVNSDADSKIIIAKWTDRFLAWLVDFIIVSMISTSIIFASFGTLDYEFMDNGFWAESMQYIPTSILFFVYWIVLEYKTGQSIGKMALQLKITNLRGEKANLKEIVISSFGKSFLLPIDIILGWIFTNKKRQRIFNKIGNTVIIKLERDEKEPENITYEMD